LESAIRFTRKKKTQKERDRKTRTGFGRDVPFFLENYGNGTEICFEGTVTTLLHEIKGKKIENKKRKKARSRIVTGLIGEQSMIALG